MRKSQVELDMVFCKKFMSYFGGHLSNKIRKIQAATKDRDFQWSRKFLSVGQSSARRHPNEVSVHYHHGVSDPTQGHLAQTGCSTSAGSKGRLPIPESQQVWPRGKALLPSLDHRAPHGKLISLEQLGPAYVSSKILQNELLLPHSYLKKKKKKKPHSNGKQTLHGLSYFPQTCLHLAQPFGHYGWNQFVFPGLSLGPSCFNTVSSTVFFGDWPGEKPNRPRFISTWRTEDWSVWPVYSALTAGKSLRWMMEILVSGPVFSPEFIWSK